MIELKEAIRLIEKQVNVDHSILAQPVVVGQAVWMDAGILKTPTGKFSWFGTAGLERATLKGAQKDGSKNRGKGRPKKSQTKQKTTGRLMEQGLHDAEPRFATCSVIKPNISSSIVSVAFFNSDVDKKIVVSS